MWGFESLLPCQFWKRQVATVKEQMGMSKGTMAEARDEGYHGGGSGGSGSGGSAIGSSFGKLGEYPRRWVQFYRDVRSEMARVVWPSRKDVISITVVVTITVAFFGLFFLGTDFIFSHLDNWVISYFKH
jgi:preprotein translocase subunit SecE